MSGRTTHRLRQLFVTAMSLCGRICIVRCRDVLLCYDSSAASDVQCHDSVFHSLVVSLVMPRLDYGNATLAGLPASQLGQLHLMLNAAARLIGRSSRYEHVTPMPPDLHWLRSPAGFDFKLVVIIYRRLHGIVSLRLHSACRCFLSSLYPVVVILAASDRMYTRLSTVGDGAFPVAGSRLLNSLPSDVNSPPTLAVFPNHFKTYLSVSAISCTVYSGLNSNFLYQVRPLEL